MKAHQFSRGAIRLFMLLLIALHVLKPEMDPLRRFISEYALGKFGILMSLAFACWALAYWGLIMALRSQLTSASGKIGLLLLGVSAIGLSMAGLFTTDPALSETHTTHGKLHGVGGTLCMAMPFASLFIGFALYKNPVYAFAKKRILCITILAVLGFLVSAIAMGYMFSQNNGNLDTGMMVGLPTRFEVLTYCIWMIILTTLIRKAGVKTFSV